MFDNFQKLNAQNYFKKYPTENPTQLWINLLNYLQEEPNNLVTDNDSGEECTPFNFIQSHIDLPESTIQEDGFFDDIVNSLIDSLPFDNNILGVYDIDALDNWNDYYWNESIARAIQYFYCTSDKRGIVSYEKDFLFEKEDATIDELRIQGGIKLNNYNDLRIIDIAESDAGNSFVREEDMYEYYDYISSYTLTISCYAKEQNGKIFPCPLVSIILDKEEILEKIPENFSKIFNKQGELQYDIINKLNLTGDYAPGASEEGKGWKGSDVFYQLFEEFEVEKLEKHAGDIQAFKKFLIEKNNYFFRGNGKENIIKIKKVINPWVIPWYNLQGFTYKYIRAADLKKSVMSNGENLLYIGESRSFNKFLDFTHSHFDHNYSENFKWLYNRLLMPEYKRKVEIEDLNRNFWTIGQTITSIMNYVLGDGGPYGKTIGNILNEIMQIWENVLFLWAQIAIQSQKRPNVHAEIVYVSLDDLTDELSYDFNQDFNDDSVVEDFIDSSGETHLIHRMEANFVILNKVIEYLRQYRLKYADYNVSLYPVIRLNNYKNNYYTRLILLGEYKYCHNWEDLAIKVPNPVPGHEDLDPEGMLINIDGKEIFYTDFSEKLPSQQDYHHCQFEESFFAYADEEDFSGTAKHYYIADIDIRDYIDNIYGISENTDEENYQGCVPLSLSNLMQTFNGEKAWGLISFNSALKINKDFPAGQWSIEVNCNGMDVTELLLKNKTRNRQLDDFNELYHFTYNSTNGFSWSDIRRDPNPTIHTFKQIEPVNNEFGYYKGELLTTYNNTTKADFNFIDLEKKLLPPSNFNGDYAEYYGMDYPDKGTINQDVKNDEIALTNYLRNAYDLWSAGEDIETFWETRQNKIELENWTEDYKEKVGYVNKKAQEFTRSTVKKSVDNENLVWDNWPNSWKNSAKNYLRFNDSTMSASTILFVEGERFYNFEPDAGTDKAGLDMVAKDGLLHHCWSPLNSSSTVSAGAAARIPIPGVGITYEFYPLHTNPSEPKNIKYGIQGRSYIYVPRNTSSIVDVRDEMPKSRPPKVKNEGEYQDFRRLPIMQPDGANTFDTKWPYTFNATDVYLTMKKKDDESFSAKNWLINHVNYVYNYYSPYFIPNTDNLENKLNHNYRASSKQSHDITYSNGVLGSSIGREKSVDAIDMQEYYEWLYQRLIYQKIEKIANSDNKTAEEVLKQATIEGIVYDKASRYYVPMKEILIGWIKINYNGQIYQAKLNADLDNLFDYSDYSEEDKEIIEMVRQYGSINKLFIRDKEAIVNFINLIPASYWGGNKPTISVLELLHLNIEDCYGYFNEHYIRKVNGTEDFSETMWLEDRAILCQYEAQRFKEQEVLYKGYLSSLDEPGWESTVNSILNANVDCYQKDTIEKSVQQIERLIKPLEGQLRVPFSLSFNEITLNIVDWIFIKNTVNDRIQIYVFGPNKKYARRGIFSYPDYDGYNPGQDDKPDGDKTRYFLGNDAGKWAARPNPEKSGYEPDDEQSLWRDDRNKTGKSVDELRKGYQVFSVSGDIDAEKIEKYKTHRNAELDALATVGTMPKAEDNDPDFGIVLKGWYYLDGTTGGE